MRRRSGPPVKRGGAEVGGREVGTIRQSSKALTPHKARQAPAGATCCGRMVVL
jgi:hypothetical protein